MYLEVIEVTLGIEDMGGGSLPFSATNVVILTYQALRRNLALFPPGSSFRQPPGNYVVARCLKLNMRKINVGELPDETWTGPDGHSIIRGKEISEALGRDPKSELPLERHPFDVEIQHVPAGTAATSFHSHSLQWEFYHVISGDGTVKSADGVEPIVAGDAFVFRPGEVHQLRAGSHDLVIYVIADNPVGDKGTIIDRN